MATKKTKPTTANKTTSPKKVSPKSTVKTIKKTTNKKVEAPSVIAEPAVKESTQQLVQGLKVRKLYIVLGLIAIALVGLAVYYRSLFVVATVNGQPISRLTYMHEIESVYLADQRVTAGKLAMNQLVTKTLLEQEARRRGVTISQKEVDTEVANTRKMLEKNNQKLESALAMQGSSLGVYQENIRIQKLIQKLIGAVAVSNKEIDDYINQNKESIPQELTGNELRNQVKQSLQSQKSNEKVQNLIQELQKKAKVNYFVTK